MTFINWKLEGNILKTIGYFTIAAHHEPNEIVTKRFWGQEPDMIENNHP